MADCFTLDQEYNVRFDPKRTCWAQNHCGGIKECGWASIKGRAETSGFTQRLLAHRFAYQRAMAMHADTAAVTAGSAHCGGKCDGCAKISPVNVAIELIVTCRATELVVRSICARRATATTAPTVPQTEARSTCSKLSARRTSERVITKKQASQAPANFSTAGRTSPLARRSSNARVLKLTLGMDCPFLVLRCYLIPVRCRATNPSSMWRA